jgi:glycosyltransferase involved in cell wall biosynthesis
MIHHKPLISIIIPTLNRSDKIIRAINSALYQTYRNLEIIIVNDHSIDETDKIVKSFIVENKKIKQKIFYIRNKKTYGNAAARNIGIEKANGEYIAFLDDDDIWLPDKIEKQVGKIISSKTSGCFCKTIWIEDDKVLKSTLPQSDIVSFESGGPTGNWLIKRDVFKKIGFFDEQFPSNVDGEFLTRFNKNYKASFVKELLYIHFYHEKQITSSNKNKIIGFEKLMKKHINILNHQEISSIYLKLTVFYLFDENKKFDYLLKSIKYRPNFNNIFFFFIMILPSIKLSKFLLNKILDFLKYPKSFAGRYKK